MKEHIPSHRSARKHTKDNERGLGVEQLALANCLIQFASVINAGVPDRETRAIQSQWRMDVGTVVGEGDGHNTNEAWT